MLNLNISETIEEFGLFELEVISLLISSTMSKVKGKVDCK